MLCLVLFCHAFLPPLPLPLNFCCWLYPWAPLVVTRFPTLASLFYFRKASLFLSWIPQRPCESQYRMSAFQMVPAWVEPVAMFSVVQPGLSWISRRTAWWSYAAQAHLIFLAALRFLFPGSRWCLIPNFDTEFDASISLRSQKIPGFWQTVDSSLFLTC